MKEQRRHKITEETSYDLMNMMGVISQHNKTWTSILLRRSRTPHLPDRSYKITADF